MGSGTTANEQRNALHRQIWKTANEMRNEVDSWECRHYILSTLFYRFISETFAFYFESNYECVDYAQMPDSLITPEIKDKAITEKGYFIYPSQLFVHVAKTSDTNKSLNLDLANIFAAIESSAIGYPSENKIKGVFSDFNTNKTRSGNSEETNKHLASTIKGVASLEFGDFNSSKIDLFGDAYEFLISKYASNAGKSGGEYFTPVCVSKLITKLAILGQTSINKVYDPTCGSGCLLLQAKKHIDADLVIDGFFGQEINSTSHNLARMNMLLHNIKYDKFDIALGNTLINPKLKAVAPFDVIVSNPPYSVKWIGSDDPTLINDERFAPAGVLAPKSKGDFAFVLHSLSYLSSKGRAAIVCFPGIFYRGGAEQKIRQYLVDNNYVEAVISLPPNLFYGTTIAVTILVLAKNKPDNNIQFIDAGGEEFFKKETNNNVMVDDHIQRIVDMFDAKENIPHVAASVPLQAVQANDYNLSVSSYVEAKDNREIIDITALNAEIEMTVGKINQLRTDIDAIIAEINA